MPTGIFLQLEVDFDEDEAVARLARYTRPGEARACRDLLVAMWRHCKRKMTDGHVPLEIVGKLAYPDTARVGMRDADRLVDCGLAERTDSGYYLPGYLKHNDSREQIEARQAKLAETGSESGSFGNHVKWHVNRNITKASCEFCRRDGRQETLGFPSGSDRVDPTDNSRGESHIDRDRDRDRDRTIDRTKDKKINSGAQRPETLAILDATERPEDARCTTHAQTLDPGPCRGCMKARERAETAKVAADAEAIRRRLECQRCGGTGHIESIDDGLPVAKCDHRPLLEVVTE